jgi:uncharacterized repeat protein (TIGR03843 family)
MSGSPDLANYPTPPWQGSSGESVVQLLNQGSLTLYGLLPWSSNYTFLGEVSDVAGKALVVYKPTRGERPLQDFPRGTLAKRETAAYILSRVLTWDLVPPTVVRRGPHGRGSVQLFVNADQEAHFFTFREDPVYLPALRALALFDVIVNNADRKGGHCLSLGSGRVVAIDQGLCFSAEPKLRTVIWDFVGEPIPAQLVSDLRRVQSDLVRRDSPLASHLEALLSAGELEALHRRVAVLLASGCYPEPPIDRRPYPWPLV